MDSMTKITIRSLFILFYEVKFYDYYFKVTWNLFYFVL